MLSKIDEFEFVQRIHLPKKTKHPIGYNFECPICDEGKSKGKKKRGFILSTSNKLDCTWYYCQNCGASFPFRTFLKDYDFSLYEEYLEKERKIFIEKIKEKNIPKSSQIRPIKPAKNEEKSIIKYYHLNESDGFIPVANSLSATKYCLKRKIPIEAARRFYFNEKITVESDGKKFYYHDMLVMPFYNGDKIYGYQARCIKNKTFYTFSQEGYKIYNFFNVDKNSNVYIFESIIDSLFVPNSIAMVGSSIQMIYVNQLKNPIFVFDNDQVDDTYNRMLKKIKKGYDIVIWPDTFKYKDVNEAICDGVTKEENYDIIKNNIFKETQAKIRLSVLKSRKRKK